MTMHELIYFAGFFDGEGSVGLYYDRNRKQWKSLIEVVQSYSPRAELEFNGWAEYFGGHVYHAARRTNCTMPLIRLQIARQKNMLTLIDDILPHTKLKTRQLIILKEYLLTKTYAFRASQLLRTLKRPS